ncbi:sulfurtransferase [Moraxella atlantae]|mgnify:FL=1|uniref:Sulfurtransferase n=1 Tax=Faucicola atlantae TaxID=34059 RepID=A0A1B8QAH5_9GAMM|nr:sulfurtransferase TusA [Moraxella atlantae]OBX76074.1 sulfurtransferase [Moraxella atlantae]
MTNQIQNPPTAQHELDTQGLICPEPIMLLHRAIRQAQSGEIIHVIATDPATTRDIANFCRHLGHTLVAEEHIINPKNLPDPDPYANVYHYWIQKK